MKNVTTSGVRRVAPICACVLLLALAPAVAATRIQDDNAAVSYADAWFKLTNEQFDGGSATTASGAGARAVFGFTGSAVRWIGYRDEWSGRANVYLDGTLQATIDTYCSPSQAQSVLWGATGLSGEGHTLTIEAVGTHNASSGGAWVWIDAFDVDAAASPSPLSFTTDSLPDGEQDAAYGATLTATGGTTPYSWSVVSGTLPAGLTLASDTGTISGTPTAAGTNTFTAQVTDADFHSATRTLSLIIRAGTWQELMPVSASAWSAFASRSQSAPVVSTSSGANGYALSISGGGLPDVYGGWRTQIGGITGGNYYRFSARALPADILSLRESVSILLRWSGSFGPEVSPDHVWDFRPAAQPEGALIFDRIIQAPAGSTSVDVELLLQWSVGGQVTFDELSLTPTAAPAPRNVRVAAIYYRPSGTQSGYESVQQAASYAEQVAINYRPDILVLGEQLNVIGAPGTPDSKAETVPGMGSDLLAGVARRQAVNIVFGIVERVADRLYNTAVLLDRDGNIAGKYRKVQLARPEAEAGMVPGDSVPVFDLDFGKVALLICNDLAFSEPAREAALQGADLLLVPFWGGRVSLARARAVENGIHLAISSYDEASEVVNPLGTVLASTGEVTGAPKVAVADIDLSRRFREPWLGDWRDISNKERRTAPYRYRVP
jgi:predicted amidohydrolase